VKIWNLIGPIICDYHQKYNRNCKIKFIEADNNAKRLAITENIMYILVLDSSGSMEGKKWQDVMAESKQFLEKL
jgi:Mg-chelatase subunit ChlD